MDTSPNLLSSLLRLVGALFGLVLLVFVGLLVYGTLTDWKPKPQMPGEALSGTARKDSPVDSTLRLAIWNIGYGGLGARMDFFMDGGARVQAPEDWQNEHLAGILSTAAARLKSADFILFQEVDRDAKRSYGIDQAESLAAQLPDHEGVFAANFKVKFIPVPFDPFPFVRPMGRVHGGLASYSRYPASSATRHDFPGSYSWPTRIYHLDRCFLEQRFAGPGEKELVVINTHNSAYDDGTLKASEMAALKDFVEAEYAQGNYVIVGGDWNQCPPDFDPKTFKKSESAYDQQNIPADYLPGWTWAYDASVPTNRKVDAPYHADSTFTTVIDFFLLSPNVEALRTEGVQLDFAFSDHQPVMLDVRLR
jgi:endonuclease/exonuclease/phosphatase family metal-dependent hydrolase